MQQRENVDILTERKMKRKVRNKNSIALSMKEKESVCVSNTHSVREREREKLICLCKVIACTTRCYRKLPTLASTMAPQPAPSVESYKPLIIPNLYFMFAIEYLSLSLIFYFIIE